MDCWKGYNDLDSYYEHYKINHSKNYVVKHFITPRNRTVKIRTHLGLFIWKRIHKNQLWDNFLEIIRDT